MRKGEKEKRGRRALLYGGGRAGLPAYGRGVARAGGRHGEEGAWRVGPAGQFCEEVGKRGSKRRQEKGKAVTREGANGDPVTDGPIGCWAGLGPVSPNSGFSFYSFPFYFFLI